MARARNIKPGFFTNGELSEVHLAGRLLFAGLWTIADREGRLEDRPKTVKAQILPFDDFNVDELLNDLQKYGFITRYQVNKIRYIQIINWGKHQNPHVKEAPSSIPKPDEHSTSTVQAPDEHQARTEQAGLIPDSLNLIPDSSNSSASVLNSIGPPSESGAAALQKKIQGPMRRTGDIANYLRSLQVDTASTRPEIEKWSKDERVTDSVLAEALAIVKNKYQDRRINSALMDWAVEEIINPKPAKARDSPMPISTGKPIPAGRSWEAPALEARGKKYGLEPMPGEKERDFDDRVYAAESKFSREKSS